MYSSSLISFLSVVFLVISITAHSQTKEPKEGEPSLYTEIIKMDSLLFKVAFNDCKLEVWEKIMSNNFEFYDDRTGLNTDRQIEINSFNDRCSKPKKVTRHMVETAVHPLGDFGAVQVGEHNFAVDGELMEKAKFIIIWERKQTDWQVKRVVSYNHRPMND